MAKYTLLTKEIREAIEKMYDSGVYTFGVRAMTRKPSGERVMVRPGDDVENSYAAYDDVEPRELGGASSVGFSVDFGKVEDEDHFNEIIERVAREYAEDEDQIAIIAGRHNLDDENNDMGETLISSPTVVSVVGDARGILAKKPIGSASESGSALPSDLLAGIQSAAPVGLGALLAGTTLAPEDAEAGVITKGGKRIIEAWHGSPHSFDKFDISKIGTGEGAQAYGHGLYFADAKDTAKNYRDTLTAGLSGTASVDEYHNAPAAEYAAKLVKHWGGPDAAIATLTTNGTSIPTGRRLEFLNAIKDGSFSAYTPNLPQGALYRTHIDVDPDTLLDWDRPLSEQPANVQAAWREYAVSPEGRNVASEFHSYKDGDTLLDIPEFADPIGETMYKVGFSGMPDVASGQLANRGIPGIRYRDQMSRGDAAEPTFNYVIFDDKPISIVERGNASPEALAATAAATATAVALNNFQSRRAAKRDYWRQMRQEITDFASAVAGGAFAALDKPLQGYMGLAGVAGTLAAGGTLPQALQQGARIAAQPSEATAYQYGGAMTDALAPYSPQGAAIAGALTNAGVQLISPL